MIAIAVIMIHTFHVYMQQNILFDFLCVLHNRWQRKSHLQISIVNWRKGPKRLATRTSGQQPSRNRIRNIMNISRSSSEGACILDVMEDLYLREKRK